MLAISKLVGPPTPRANLAVGGHTAICRQLRVDWFLLVYVLVVVAAIISRRPDALNYPQFWAEDGTWFEYDYNLGIVHALRLPLGGDFQTFPRLAAGLAMAFPLRDAPLVMNVIAILVQSLAPIFLVTKRFERIAPRAI